MTAYQPMTLADLGIRLARTADAKVRWKLVWEFLEEYRWEPEEVQPLLLRDELARSVTNAGTHCWPPWQSISPRSTTWPRRTGRSSGSCGARGSLPS